jgi:hypothetical protein
LSKMGTSSVPEKDPANRIPSATWQKIAADIERLALTNDKLRKELDELHHVCMQAFNENEWLKKLLRDHNVPLSDPPS